MPGVFRLWCGRVCLSEALSSSATRSSSVSLRPCVLRLQHASLLVSLVIIRLSRAVMRALYLGQASHWPSWSSPALMELPWLCGCFSRDSWVSWLQRTRVAFFYWPLILQGPYYECFRSKDWVHGLSVWWGLIIDAMSRYQRQFV